MERFQRHYVRLRLLAQNLGRAHEAQSQISHATRQGSVQIPLDGDLPHHSRVYGQTHARSARNGTAYMLPSVLGYVQPRNQDDVHHSRRGRTPERQEQTRKEEKRENRSVRRDDAHSDYVRFPQPRRTFRPDDTRIATGRS